ncbi:MAG: hypothetical protein KDE55_09235 [Novosphingobium sp.]|nr:hypothetical protein [Novosphingobium sp.]
MIEEDRKMTAVLLGALFISTAVLAIFAIVSSVRAFGRHLLAMRKGLSSQSRTRELRFTISEIRVDDRRSNVLRPAFGQRVVVTRAAA